MAYLYPSRCQVLSVRYVEYVANADCDAIFTHQ